uniref:Uncharacterized protein n=1 Tax=Pseudoalteromonas rubra TaxID=43658 RepID=A0A0F4QA89_9GAMM|nr:hypothetical protein TW77_23355 [Pseudoalteromonas rubra]
MEVAVAATLNFVLITTQSTLFFVIAKTVKRSLDLINGLGFGCGQKTLPLQKAHHHRLPV